MSSIEASHQPRGDVTKQPRLLVLRQPRPELLLCILTELRHLVCDLLVLEGVEAARGVEQAGDTLQSLVRAEARISSL